MSTAIGYGITEIYRVYDKTKKIILADFEQQESFDHVNPFWKNILSKRKNFPSFGETLSFLNNNSAYGLGKRTEDNLESERQSYVDATLALKRLVGNNYLDVFSESMIGSPKYFDENGILGSTSFTENMMSSVRLIELVDKHLKDHDKINVLEIGSGWGAAIHHLIQYYGDRINKVTLCDLHENLFIASVYLQSTFPDRNVCFIPRNGIAEIKDHSLNFCPPNNINNVLTEFDLVFNMISFQEMSINVIHEYMVYIREHLAPGGIFYSENGVTVKEKTGRAAKASDYKYLENFKILNLRSGARFCPHLFFGNKHEILLTAKVEGEKPLDSKYLDALCFLMETRLDENISDLKNHFMSGSLTDEECMLMDFILEFFASDNTKTKKQLLDKMGRFHNSAIHNYLSALYLISRRSFTQAMPFLVAAEKELTGLVKINALCYIGILDKKQQPEALIKIKSLSPEMYSTAAGLFSKGLTSRRYIVGKISILLNICERKWFGYSTNQLSLIPNILWNRFLSILGKKIASLRNRSVLPYYLK